MAFYKNCRLQEEEELVLHFYWMNGDGISMIRWRNMLICMKISPFDIKKNLQVSTRVFAWNVGDGISATWKLYSILSVSPFQFPKSQLL